MAKGMSYEAWCIARCRELELGNITAVEWIQAQSLDWGGDVVRIPKVADLEKEMAECPEMLARFLAKVIRKAGQK